jgi:phosphate starvation-inducible protein PhoH
MKNIKGSMKKNKNELGSEVKKDKTVKVFQKEKISYHLNLAKPDWTPKQQELIEIIKDANSKYTFVKGASGTSKTFISLAVALELLNAGRIKEIILVRSIVESGVISLGSLPGTSDEKMSPFMAPFNEKLSELLPKEDIKKLHDDHRILSVPVNHLRGRQFTASFIIADEAQNMTIDEIQTLLTRFGKYSKLVVCGDTEQCDFVKGKKLDSGFKTFYDWYNKPEAVTKGIHCFKFGIEDIMREDVIKYVVQEYDELRKHLSSGDYRPSQN